MNAATGMADSQWWPTRTSLLAAIGVVLLGGVAVIKPSLALALPLAVAFVVIAFRSLAAGLALFTLLISLEYVPELEADVGLIKAAGAVLVAAWVTKLVRSRQETPLLLRERPWTARTLIALAVWALASSLWAADSSVALSSASRLSQGILLLFVVYTALHRLAHVRWVLGAYIVGALLTVGLGLLSPASATDAGRLSGAVGDPNELAAFLIPAVMLCAFSYLGGSRALDRGLLLTAGVFLLVAVFLTGSRGGLVALGTALLAAVALAGRERLKSLAAVLVIAGCGVAYYTALASPDQVDRLATIRSDGGTGRSDIWAVAWETVRDRPIAGIGAGNFPVVEGRYATRDVDIGRIDLVLDKGKVVHNTYLSFLSELGLVGFAAFALVVLAAILTSVRALRNVGAPWALQLELRGFATGLLGVLVAFAFFSAQYEKQLWLLLGVAFALPACLPRSREHIATGLADGTSAYHPSVPRGTRAAEKPAGDTRDDEARATAQRLARREAGLAAREQSVALRELTLRGLASDLPAGSDTSTPELALRDAALAAAAAQLEELRRSLEETVRSRDLLAESLAETNALVAELREQAEQRRAADERQKSTLRAQIRALQNHRGQNPKDDKK